MENQQDAGVEIGDVLPDEPGIVRFLNTIWADRGGPRDDLETKAHVQVWLSRAGYRAPSSLTHDDAAAMRDLRDALRRLAAHRTEDPRSKAESPMALGGAVELVNSIAGAPARGPQIAVRGRSDLEKVGPGPVTADDVLRVLALEGIEALAGPDRVPLRVCLAPSCVLYFVQDHPRRAWCSTACGNRARAARHYARSRH